MCRLGEKQPAFDQGAAGGDQRRGQAGDQSEPANPGIAWGTQKAKADGSRLSNGGIILLLRQ